MESSNHLRSIRSFHVSMSGGFLSLRCTQSQGQRLLQGSLSLDDFFTVHLPTVCGLVFQAMPTKPKALPALPKKRPGPSTAPIIKPATIAIKPAVVLPKVAMKPVAVPPPVVKPVVKPAMPRYQPPAMVATLGVCGRSLVADGDVLEVSFEIRKKKMELWQFVFVSLCFLVVSGSQRLLRNHQRIHPRGICRRRGLCDLIATPVVTLLPGSEKIGGAELG